MTKAKLAKQLLINLAGILTAFIVAEFCLDLFATDKAVAFSPTSESLDVIQYQDDNTSKIKEIKQFQEGYGISHFRGDGSRITGNPQLDGIPTGIIIGDSFVEALQVNDTQTMGAEVERLSRRDSNPFNVRQYGWGGASTATYIAISEVIKQRWNPKWVAVVYNEDDFSVSSIRGGRFWQMEVNNSDFSVNISPVARTGQRFDPVLEKLGFTTKDLRGLLNKSTLLYLIFEKYLVSTELQNNASLNSEKNTDKQKSDEIKIVATGTIRALKKAYGSSLAIIYTPQIAMTSTNKMDDTEAILFSICQSEEVKFVSARDEMVKRLKNKKQLSEGFSNTSPGEGHLNNVGHEVVGQIIWDTVSK
jgi:hypothetical protein